MFRTIYVVLYLIIYLLGITPYLIKAQSYAKKGLYSQRDALVARQAQLWGQKLIKSTGSTVKVTGLDNIPKDTSVVFVGNHSSYFDIPLLIGYVNKPIAFIAKKEMQKVPFLSKWMEQLKCVFIDRSNPKEGLKAIIKGVEFIKDGYSMVIFPEGTRSSGGDIGSFKGGSLKLALKAAAPIVPVTMKNTAKVYEANGKATIKPAELELIIHPALATKDLTKEAIDELPEKLRNIITSEL